MSSLPGVFETASTQGEKLTGQVVNSARVLLGGLLISSFPEDEQSYEVAT